MVHTRYKTEYRIPNTLRYSSFSIFHMKTDKVSATSLYGIQIITFQTITHSMHKPFIKTNRHSVSNVARKQFENCSPTSAVGNRMTPRNLRRSQWAVELST